MTTLALDHDFISGADLPGELEDFPWEDVDEEVCERCGDACRPSPLGLCGSCDYITRRTTYYQRPEKTGTPHAAVLAGETA